MNAPRHTRPVHPVTLLAAAIGLSLAAGAAWSAPPIADAQDQSTQQLQKTRSDVMPPPANSTDATRGARTGRDSAIQAKPTRDKRAGTAAGRASTGATPPTDANRAQWSQLDADGDGRISRSEGSRDADFTSNFEMIDADSDGYISETEMGARGMDEDDTHEPEEDDWR